MSNEERYEIFGGCMAIVVILACIIALPFILSAKTVQDNQTCVIVRNGEVKESVGAGLYFAIPFIEEYHCYPTTVLTYEVSGHPDDSKASYTDYSISALTPDGQRVRVNYTVQFRIDSSRATDIYKEIGPSMDNVVEVVVKSLSRSYSRTEVTRYPAEQLYSEEGQLAYAEKLRERLTGQAEQRHVIIEDVLVRDIIFDADYETAIERQQITELEIRRQEFENERKISERNAEATAVAIDTNTEVNRIKNIGAALQDYPALLQWQLIQALETVTWMVLPDSILPAMNLPGASAQVNP